MRLLAKKFKQVKESIVENKMIVCFVGLILFCFWANSAFAVDPTGDILGTAKGDITKNFGESSTVMYGVYMAEIFAGVAAYIKTKNLFSLLGLVIVLIFTSIGFSLIGS